MISLPARQDQVEKPATEVDDPASVTGPVEVVDQPPGDGQASDDLASDGPASDGPADDGPAYDGSAGDGSARVDEPAAVDGPEKFDDPASQPSAKDGPALQDDDPAGVAGPAHLQTFVLEDPADLGTPAVNTPSAGWDSSILTGVSSPLFPLMPTSINRATLTDFMSMWTLPQRRMDQGMTFHPGGLTLCLGLQTETCSRSPVTRSSSVDSPTRDGSPVNFSAALDPEDKVKENYVTNDEDEDGNHKKISSAQYQLFRQAVTTSKGSFKVNPAKTHRASRASLLDLGDSEVTDRVSWLDQPSLKDTMASTACIAQGLKEDEEVKMTTLSETPNTASSTFKHLTVKQIFPR